MKIILPKEEDGFKISPQKFCGVDCFLITPAINPEWNLENLHFRSLVVSKRWKTVLSSGYKKFFNQGERTGLYPNITNFTDVYAETKHDGTLVIVDYHNKQFSMRTRGTVSYLFQQNSSDFEVLLKLYPKVLDVVKQNKNFSFFFELETPNNVIVIRTNSINFTFLGAICKNTLLYMPNEQVEECSRLMEIPRPRRYEFQSISDLSLLVKEWKGKEGVVLSYNNFQNKLKLKSDWYLFIHKIKSHLNSNNNLISFYVDKEMPDFDNFYKIIESEFDFEIANQLKEEIKKISYAGAAVKKYISTIHEMVRDIRNVSTRKEQANMIIRNFKENSSIAFSALDNKQITKSQLLKLIKLKIDVDSQ